MGNEKPERPVVRAFREVTGERYDWEKRRWVKTERADRNG